MARFVVSTLSRYSVYRLSERRLNDRPFGHANASYLADSRLSLGPALVRLNRQWGCYLQVHGPRIQIPGTGGILKEALVDGSIACAIIFGLLDRPKFAADEIVALQVLPGSKGLLQPKGGWHDEIPCLGVGKIPREVAPAAE